jgi:dienelactone hydrolase
MNLHEEPLFLSCAEVDHTFDTPSRRRALEILQTEKKPYQLQLFSGVQHGFALRGDLENPYERQLPLLRNIHLIM